MGRMSNTEAKIPVIDFSGDDLKPGTNSWLQACNRVCNALEDYGCFVATLSGADCLELHNTIFGSLDDLFDFPKENKLKNTYKKPFRGYHSPNPVHEGLGIDDPTDPEATHQFTKLFWPHGNHHFGETANSYAKLVTGLDQTVTRMIFEHYGVEKYCESHIGSTDYVLRLHKYNAADKEKTHKALPEHTDLNLTTIIHQNHVNGLEVKTKHGEQWIGFDASPNSFIFMTGDGFQVWSNDRIQPCLHRVTMSANAVRYSVLLSTFHNGIITVPEELIDDEHPLKYKPLNHQDYLASQLALPTSRVCVKNFCGL
ncbi:probable 2-oxoglutarate-dependent dioxygenase AOP1 [Argentina anserina]|uniref:probable 2-oxoglutarate-dependent dioxygenase AOP1 n=1 Tax=Argentina anserina TaxID=57926 RepID=UPI0021764EFB|nr:probable 2-oxoglutarate-dependent dioxygenase AOP1 [Potentilla anserina]